MVSVLGVSEPVAGSEPLLEDPVVLVLVECEVVLVEEFVVLVEESVVLVEEFVVLVEEFVVLVVEVVVVEHGIGVCYGGPHLGFDAPFAPFPWLTSEPGLLRFLVWSRK